MIQFAWPWLFAVLPLPLLIRWLLPRAEQQQQALRVPFYEQVKHAGSPVSSSQGKRWHGWAALVIWLLLVVSAARPEWVGEPVSLPVDARDMMIAVDISGSMKQTDLQLDDEPATRLQVVKSVLADFIERRKGDRLGLLLFGTQAYLQAPLTFDRTTVATLLTEAQIGFAGEKTAIGDAIGLAIKRLQAQPAESRTLLLLTDGANTAGEVSPEQAAQLAQQEGITIHTIGVGADEMVTEGGLFGFGKRRINPSIELDEKLLTQIAEQTGGRYFRAKNTQQLEQIYTLLDQIEPIAQDAQSYLLIKAIFSWPLALALALSALWGLSLPLRRLGQLISDAWQDWREDHRERGAS